MKKIIASASLAALGAVSAQAAYAPGLTSVERSKPWSISVSLRGFYDDNYTTSPSDVEQDSFGISVSPSLTINVPLEQTLLSLNYTYEMRWYEDRDDNSADHFHNASIKIDHAFSERYKLKLSDNFVYAQEPTVNDPSGIITTPTRLRTEADYLHNTAKAFFEAEITRQFGLGLGYENNIWNYEQDGPGSRSALLDRMEHLATIDFRWHVQPGTIGLLGYQFLAVDHTSNDSIAQNVPIKIPATDPEVRDQISHFAFVGVDHQFSSQLQGQVRLGAQFTDYINGDQLIDEPDDEISPYADASVTWTYNPGSYLQAGIRHIRNQTDIAYQGSLEPTLDQESTALYMLLNHRITPRLTGSLLGQYQNSEFNGGAADDEADNIFIAGVNLTYQMSQWISAEAGYNYDRLDSDLPFRSYTRNRVYVGLRATY